MGYYSEHVYKDAEALSRSSLSSNDSRESLDLTTEELLGSSKGSQPRHVDFSQGRERPTFYRRAVRLAVGSILLGSLLGLGVVLHALEGEVDFRTSYSILNSSEPSGDLSFAQNELLPATPTPIASAGDQGQQNWTVWIPRKQTHPLEPSAYAKLCASSDELAQHLAAAAHGHNRTDVRTHFPYYHQDERYMEVAEAENRTLLPKAPPADPRSTVPAAALPPSSTAPLLPLCPRTLTFVLESADPGLGVTLLALWTAYGLAVRENRAFFVDDRRWAYGRWADYFAPPPAPSCRPPPDAHRVPCPRHAAHVLVSSATRARAFGHAFVEQFEDPREAGARRQRPIFALLRAGYEALWKPSVEDEAYVAMRVEGYGGKETVGVHVRHGDRHPLEFAYQKSYIPLQRYLSATAPNATQEASPVILVASDDPAVYAAPEFVSTTRAQDRYDLSNPSFVTAGVNWTGGVTAAAFWRMGQVNEDAVRGPLEGPPDEVTIRLRWLVGRSFVLDLAVLGRADRVACAVSSAACRLLAVMMGWERAMEEGRWVNVDGDFDWTGIRW